MSSPGMPELESSANQSAENPFSIEGDPVAPHQTTWTLIRSIDDGRSAECIAVANNPFTIGREGSCDLRFHSPAVSLQHAELTPTLDGLLVRDLESTNGTFINGFPVEGESILDHGDVLQIANVCLRVSRTGQSELSPQAANLSCTSVEETTGNSLGLSRFSTLISEKAVMPQYQPVVCIHDGNVLGYEVFGRSRLFGLTSPKEMFLAATRLDREAELSRVLREEGVKSAEKIPAEERLFFNVHPSELRDPADLTQSLLAIKEIAPQRRMVLEIPANAELEHQQMLELVTRYSEMGIEIVYDDFGEGRARLLEMMEIVPLGVKFDRRFSLGASAFSAHHRKRLQALIRMIREFGIVPICKGVECSDDADACEAMGFEWGQGFHYGRPVSKARFR